MGILTSIENPFYIGPLRSICCRGCLPPIAPIPPLILLVSLDGVVFIVTGAGSNPLAKVCPSYITSTDSVTVYAPGLWKVCVGLNRLVPIDGAVLSCQFHVHVYVIGPCPPDQEALP